MTLIVMITKLKILLLFLMLTAFQQNETVSFSETEKIIQIIIEGNVDLKTGEYIVYNRLVDISHPNLDSWINEYGLSISKTACDSIIKHCSLQLLNDTEIEAFKVVVDSINKNLTHSFEKENKYSLIKEKTGKEYCEFSKPLYSKKGKYALIRFDVISGFMYGSFSRIYLMEKVNGQWTENSILEITED